MKRFIFIIGVLVFGNIYLYSDVLQDVVANYDCDYNVQTTRVSDNNTDGIYDTYTITWCNGESIAYPIVAIGDIEKWPPRGIPSRNITYANYSSNTFREDYYSTTSTVSSCFIKQQGVDSVYFYSYGNAQLYFTDVKENIDLPELTLYPNPTSDFVYLNYILNSSKSVKIYIYDEIGNQVEEIDNKLQNPGIYNISISTANLVSGNYMVVVRFDLETIISKKLSIVK